MRAQDNETRFNFQRRLQNLLRRVTEFNCEFGAPLEVIDLRGRGQKLFLEIERALHLWSFAFRRHIQSNELSPETLT
jgi:hypothetical protein